MPGERGSITLLALWAVAVIAALLSVAAMTTRSEIDIAGNAVAGSRARLAAEAATQLGLARLLRRPDAAFDGTPQTWRDDGATVELAIADEAGKIDLNQAPLDLLAGLFAAVGRPAAEAHLLACNILDRRGEAAPDCPEGARRSYRFAAPEEVAQLPGFDEALYTRIADSVTVASGAAAIDPAVAPRDVLLALPGATPGLVDSYLKSREAWRDFGPAADMLKTLPVGGMLWVSPHRDFTVAAVAHAGRAAYRAELTVRLTGIANPRYRVLAWRAPPVLESAGAGR
jgi:general secretion pathway protein K